MTCEDEKLNTTETSLVDKKVTCEINHCVIYTISLLIIYCLLSVVISISCYYYYAKHRVKREYSSLYWYKINSLNVIVHRSFSMTWSI